VRTVWLVVAILVAIWLIGAVLNLVGAAIHTLLIAAIVLVLVLLFRRRPA
jgi:hypothetical protein